MSSHRSTLTRPASRGIALVTALLIVAVAMATITPQAARERVAVAGTANLIDGAQARMVALGLEHWVATILRDDTRADDVDHLGENWATPVPAFSAGRATVGGRLIDLRGRLNLNAVIQKDGQLNLRHFARLQRLIVGVGLDVAIADAIVDWIDIDDLERLPHGVESAHYASLEPAYRAANRALVSVSELRLVAGIDADAYAVLAPHVSALDHRPDINVNTATLPVLMAIGTSPDRAAMGSFLARRIATPLRGIAGLREEQAFSQPEIELDGLSFSSNCFHLTAAVQLPRASRSHHAIFYRDGDSVSVRGRWVGDL